MEDSPEDNYALARLDLPAVGTQGWQVRLQRNTIRYSKFFSDRQYGNAALAKKAAQQWRDQLLETSNLAEQARICRTSPRNRSGVIGVSKVTVTTNGASYQFWQATWSPQPGVRKTIKFSISRYGDQEAFRLAVIARESATQAPD